MTIHFNELELDLGSRQFLELYSACLLWRIKPSVGVVYSELAQDGQKGSRDPPQFGTKF